VYGVSNPKVLLAREGLESYECLQTFSYHPKTKMNAWLVKAFGVSNMVGLTIEMKTKL
jgi:hypothetical protein